MSSLFHTPKMTTPTSQGAAPITVRDFAADEAKRKTRKPTGRQDSLLAGVANALKTRLGE